MLLEELTRRFPALRRLPPGAYAVGGAVRDLLLGREPVDVDVAVPDVRAATNAIGGRVIELGRGELVAHRVIRSGSIYDLAEIAGGRDRDLARRDCTINAIAVDLGTGELLDPHGGRADLAARRVRMIRAGNFDDDPLRLLKVIRVAVQLDFDIDPSTLDAIRARAASIATVAPERVTSELMLVLGAQRLRRACALLHETRLDAELFGQSIDVAGIGADDLGPAAALAVLVTDVDAAAERWRWSEQLRRDAVTLQRLLATPGRELRVALYDAGESVARQARPLFRAQGRDLAFDDALFAITPLLSGDEIREVANIAPGPELGRIKRALLVEQIEGRLGTRDDAVAFVARSSRR